MVFVFGVIYRRKWQMINLYTTHCPQCEVLKAKLDEKGIEYNVIEDVKKMREMGLMSAPALQIEDDVLTFSQAIKWVREYGE